jgi:multimeric flavodoxin WrbA
MNVVAVNGSPHQDGNTFLATRTVCEELQKDGIETRIVHVGNKAIRGCMACNQCAKKRNEACSLDGDDVNAVIQEMKAADGIILASPVYFAAIAGTMKSFLDRAFRVAGANNGLFRHKVGASVVADRRAGGVPTYNQLNNYIGYAEMFMPGSNYWNVVFGTAPGEAQHDLEGLQTMRTLGRNMAWLLKATSERRERRALPEREAKIVFSYIR